MVKNLTKIVDINGNTIKNGDVIKWWNFYWNEGSSEDYFGTVPEESWYVIEAFMEQLISEVVEYKSALCVKYRNKFISLKEITENNDLENFENLYNDERFEVNEWKNFLSERVFDDRCANKEEVYGLMNKFEIIEGDKK
jgi:hypothetical protein